MRNPSLRLVLGLAVPDARDAGCRRPVGACAGWSAPVVSVCNGCLAWRTSPDSHSTRRKGVPTPATGERCPWKRSPRRHYAHAMDRGARSVIS